MGLYFADLVINDLVILELKAEEMLTDAHKARLLNYLRGTNYEIGYAFNFGTKPDFSRKIFTNDCEKVAR